MKLNKTVCSGCAALAVIGAAAWFLLKGDKAACMKRKFNKEVDNAIDSAISAISEAAESVADALFE